MAGFVRTDDEVAKIQERLTENRFFDTQRLSVRYRTEPPIVERVLPPGLEPADEPMVQADVYRVDRSNCVGSFEGAALYVKAQHDGEVGNYCLAMPMSTDAAITWGRELFGEPKKRANVTLAREGDDFRGSVMRYGESILELKATMEETSEPDPGTRSVFHYKYLPDATGEGFQFDPTLVKITFDSDVHQYETGTGTVTLATTEHDPLGEIVVEEVVDASYAVVDSYTSQENVTTVDPVSFLPYAYDNGSVDDWLTLDNLSAASDSGAPE